MSDINPYATLTEDPTTSLAIYWIDQRDGADGSDQTLDYDGGSEIAYADEIPESDGVYRYYCTVDGLSPETVYNGTIDGEKEIEWKTLPEEIPDDGLHFGVSSDWHIDRDNAMPDPEGMQPIKDENLDFHLFAGDYGTRIDDVDEDNTEKWIRLLEEYYGVLNEDRIVPTLPVPGNHEVGNHSYDGLDSVNPDAGYFRFFFRHPNYLPPVGSNYGSVEVGDYLQILAADTHSSRAPTVGSWLERTANPTFDFSVVYFHAPMLPGLSHDSEFYEEVRRQYAPTLDRMDNIGPVFSGHMHVRSRSVPWTITDEEPDEDYIDLDEDGYLIENPDVDDISVVEFGGGYRDARDPEEEWYLDLVEEGRQFYTVTLEQQSETQVTVRELDEDGEEYNSATFYPESTEPERERVNASGGAKWTFSDGRF